MKNFLAALIAGVGAISGMAAELPFPEWRDGEFAELQSAGWVPGALLLTNEPLPDDPATPAEPLVLESPLPDEVAEDPATVAELPEQFLEAYFAARPELFLVDPQGLLSPADQRDRLTFLNYHASDSSIDLFVYVLGGEQEIPTDVRHEELVERLFNDGRPAAVVHYYLGNPKRSTVRLSPSLMDQIPAAEQHRALENSVRTALEKTNPSEQLDKFLVQLSIRIYWMEKAIMDDPQAAEGGDLAGAAVVAPLVKKPDRFQKVREWVLPYVRPAAVAAGILLSLVCLIVWLRSRARYQFPEFDVEPRLGGDHAAGIGSVISFASAAVPPASQRDQMPEYLRRA